MPTKAKTVPPTKVTPPTAKVLRHNALKAAAAIVRSGGLIVYPTDTIWGLGCDATNAAAVKNLRGLKKKPADAPLIWLLPSLKAVAKYCGAIEPTARKLLLKPHTTVVINGQSVRVVRHGWVNKLLTHCGVPLVATSANRHGQPPVMGWRAAVREFGDAVTVIKGRKIYHHRPSTVVAVKDGQTTLIRA